jgi:hypothetical protein
MQQGQWQQGADGGRKSIGDVRAVVWEAVAVVCREVREMV